MSFDDASILVTRKIAGFIERAVEAIANTSSHAELRVRVYDVGWDDDGCPVVDIAIEERVSAAFDPIRVPNAAKAVWNTPPTTEQSGIDHSHEEG